MYVYVCIVNIESHMGERFAVFEDFQQTTKVFPTNFINLYKALLIL